MFLINTLMLQRLARSMLQHLSRSMLLHEKELLLCSPESLNAGASLFMHIEKQPQECKTFS